MTHHVAVLYIPKLSRSSQEHPHPLPPYSSAWLREFQSFLIPTLNRPLRGWQAHPKVLIAASVCVASGTTCEQPEKALHAQCNCRLRARGKIPVYASSPELWDNPARHGNARARASGRNQTVNVAGSSISRQITKKHKYKVLGV